MRFSAADNKIYRHTMMKTILKTLPFSLLAWLFGCTNEAYESGDGRYSDMRADFAEAQTDGSAAVISFTTDDGESLTLTQAVKPSWAEKGDTTYRALIYYNKVENSQGAERAEAVMLRNVIVPAAKPLTDFKDGVKTDPVSLNSSWISASQRWLNLDLSLKTGKSDDEDAAQTLGLALESVEQDSGGHCSVTLTLYHDQGTVPEYYSTTCYVSVPLFRAPVELSAGDTVTINIQTYNGKVSKTFTIKD